MSFEAYEVLSDEKIFAINHVLAQYFGIEQIFLVVGCSMGAQLAFHWGECTLFRLSCGNSTDLWKC